MEVFCSFREGKLKWAVKEVENGIEGFEKFVGSLKFKCSDEEG